MHRLAIPVLLTFLTFPVLTASPLPEPQGQPSTKASTGGSPIVIPAGTTVSLALTSPIRANSAKAGDSIYAETAFPVAVNNHMAIPTGTYVQGQIDALTRPGRFSPHAELRMHFTKIIFANGYTVEVPGTATANAGAESALQSAAAPEAALTPGDDVIPAVGTAYVLVSSRSDILLDNGSQLEMVLQLPLRLSSDEVAAAVRQSIPAPLGQFKSATQCRPIPGSPGTPDTVIPGTPGTSGTPPTMIPGAPGMPDTIIPGTPATPGTPDTILPGSPSRPYLPCPGPPIVSSNTKALNYNETFQIGAPVQVYGKPLAAGSYQVRWKGLAPLTQVEIHQNGNQVESVQARVVLLSKKSPSDIPGTSTNPDGSLSLRSLRFAGQSFALYFDHDGE